MKKILLTIFLTSIAFPQSEAGAIFLLISPDPIMNGLGGIGACLPSKDPFASYFNPANGIDVGEGMFYTSSKIRSKWLPNLASDIFLNYEVKSIGLVPQDHRIKVVVTSHKSLLDLGEQIYYNSTFRSTMSMRGVTVGMNYSKPFRMIPINLSFGITSKRADQNLENNYSSERLFDYGILWSVPKVFHFPTNRRYLKKFQRLNVNFVPSFGYSVSNITDSITFHYGDPAPKYLRTGVSAILALAYNSEWNILEWSGGRMASDIMIDRDQLKKGKIKYQSGFGDIDFIDNVIRNKPDSLITVHRGDEWTFLDIYTIRTGRKIDLGGKINLKTSGYGYRLSGVLKILHLITKDRIYKILLNYIDIQYNYSKWEDVPGHPLNYTYFESWSVTANNVDQLILKFLD